MSTLQPSPVTVPADPVGFQTDEPLRVRQVATALRVSERTAYYLVASGRLPSYRTGTGRGSIRIQRSDFRAYLKSEGIPLSAVVPVG